MCATLPCPARPLPWSRSSPQLTGLPDTPYGPVLSGLFLVGHPLRELYNKVCAALDAASRKVVDPIQAFVVNQAAPIAGGLAAFWLAARDLPLRLGKGVAGAVAYFLVGAWQRRPQGAQASPGAVAVTEAMQ